MQWGGNYSPVTQTIYPPRGGTTTYTVIAPTADVNYKLTASTEGGWIARNGTKLNTVSGGAGSYNTVSGAFQCNQGDVITVSSQSGNYVHITENF